MRLVFALLLIPTIATASPKPSLEILDRGEAIEIIARNVKAARTSISPVRQRLEIELVGYPRAYPLAPVGNLVKVIELSGSDTRVLSVKLTVERPEVKSLARFAQAIQVGDDLHLLFPRTIPPEGSKFVLPEPTLPPDLVAKLAKHEAAIKPEPKPESKPDAELDARLGLKVATPDREAPVAPLASVPTTKPDQPAIGIAEEPTSRLSLYVMLGLAAIGCGVWILRRRKAAQPPTSSIEVIAQRSLGAKAKVVWLAAGGREMVVSVTAQQVRMLGQWRKQGAPASLPTALALPEPRTPARADRPAKPAQSSVAGILRLRQQTAAPVLELDEDIVTGDLDADALWAKEILAATGGRR